MSQILTQLIKWTAIPVLMFASMFSYFAMRHERLLAGAVILGVIIFIGRAVRSRQYFWAMGLVSVVVAFSPLYLVIKIFVSMGLACIASIGVVVAGFRKRSLPTAPRGVRIHGAAFGSLVLFSAQNAYSNARGIVDST